MEYSNLFVCIMGISTVFFGLICLVGLTMLMSAVCGKLRKEAPAAPAPAPVPAAPVENREALAAAIAAAVAEELGTDITGIRIVSMKKL